MIQKSKKIVLTGHFNVGKTSLIKKFVHSIFSEQYLSTIGVNIEKKQVIIDDTQLNMIIWELAGEDSVDKTPRSYLMGTHGIIYVFDLTRESTWLNLQEQLDKLKIIVPNVPISIIGNKNDLISEKERDAILQSLPVNCSYTSSAKTGENVERLFMELAKELVG